jgi:hypothetical protein
MNRDLAFIAGNDLEEFLAVLGQELDKSEWNLGEASSKGTDHEIVLLAPAGMSAQEVKADEIVKRALELVGESNQTLLKVLEEEKYWFDDGKTESSIQLNITI